MKMRRRATNLSSGTTPRMSNGTVFDEKTDQLETMMTINCVHIASAELATDSLTVESFYLESDKCAMTNENGENVETVVEDISAKRDKGKNFWVE